MKRVLVSLLVLGVAMLGLSALAYAGPNANAKIQMHVMSALATGKTAPPPCTQGRVACAGISTHGELYPWGLAAQYYFNPVWILVTDGDATAGVAGVQFGLQYPHYSNTGAPGTPGDGLGLFFQSWTLCATLEFRTPTPEWPRPGCGNLITWDAGTVCQRTEPGGAGTGVVAVAGYFKMCAYEPCDMCIIPRPVDGKAKVAACNAVEDVVAPLPSPDSHLGCIGWGPGHNGYNPCGLITPVENTTWGAIKAATR